MGLELDDLVSLPGYLQGVEKATELMSADIFMLPTYHGEGCPNCILEAMGAGLPVITVRGAAWAEALLPELAEALAEVTGVTTILKNAGSRGRALEGLDDVDAVVDYEDKGVNDPVSAAVDP